MLIEDVGVRVELTVLVTLTDAVGVRDDETERDGEVVADPVLDEDTVDVPVRETAAELVPIAEALLLGELLLVRDTDGEALDEAEMDGVLVWVTDRELVGEVVPEREFVREADEVLVGLMVPVLVREADPVRVADTDGVGVAVVVLDLVADGERELEAVGVDERVVVDVADIFDADGVLVLVREAVVVGVASADLVAVRVTVALFVGFTAAPSSARPRPGGARGRRAPGEALGAKGGANGVARLAKEGAGYDKPLRLIPFSSPPLS